MPDLVPRPSSPLAGRSRAGYIAFRRRQRLEVAALAAAKVLPAVVETMRKVVESEDEDTTLRDRALAAGILIEIASMNPSKVTEATAEAEAPRITLSMSVDDWTKRVAEAIEEQRRIRFALPHGGNGNGNGSGRVP